MKCHTDILILNEFFKKFYSIHDYLFNNIFFIEWQYLNA